MTILSNIFDTKQWPKLKLNFVIYLKKKMLTCHIAHGLLHDDTMNTIRHFFYNLKAPIHCDCADARVYEIVTKNTLLVLESLSTIPARMSGWVGGRVSE